MSDAQLKLNLSRTLHSQLKRAAADNARSLNAEIALRLETSFASKQVLSAEISRSIGSYVEAEVSRRLVAIASQIGGGK